jgi:hypothetical protein
MSFDFFKRTILKNLIVLFDFNLRSNERAVNGSRQSARSESRPVNKQGRPAFTPDGPLNARPRTSGPTLI